MVYDLRGIWQAEIAVQGEITRINFPVPGDIVSAVMSAGKIPDPYFDRNELAIQWIGNSHWKAWTDFSISEISSDNILKNLRNALLDIEIADTAVEVYLNNIYIGRGQNMFHPLRLPVTESLKAGRNRLELRFQSAVQVAEEKAKTLPYSVPTSKYAKWSPAHQNLIRKVQCHGGWDWGPCIMPSGVYGDLVLRTGRDACLQSLHCSAVPEGKEPREAQWELRTEVEYASYKPAEDIQIYFLLEEVQLDYHQNCKTENHPPDNYQEKLSTYAQWSEVFSLKEGLNHLISTQLISKPKLWWPKGYGDQSLYILTISLGEVEIKRTIGFRKLELISKDDAQGRSMYFRVNNRDIYAKGANWIPVDAIPAFQKPKTYEELLSDMSHANMNMVRVWGGGQYEKDIFYELCDRLGILVWQDMMFACALYPAEEDFLAEVEAEIDYQVKRLRHHPCIALWCGNNENLGALGWFEESRKNRDRYLVGYDRLNEGVIGRLVRAIDPDRPWWPSSPSAGMGDYSDCWHDDSKGDMHYWSVWHEGLPFESYYDVIPRFCSEFGFQSFPLLETIETFAPKEAWNITSPTMLHHQRHDRGNALILSTIANYFRMPKNFEQTLYLSQVQQSYAIRTAVDYWRSKKPQNMGALYWQLNDLWPVASWSSIEYGGKWKLLQYAAAQFFAPLSLSLFCKDDRVEAHAVSELDRSITLAVSIRLFTFSGDLLQSWEFDAELSADSAQELWSISFSQLPNFSEGGALSPNFAEDSFVHARIAAKDATCEKQETCCFLSKPQNCRLAQANPQISEDSERNSFIISSDKPLFYLLPQTRIAGRFSKGCFTLLPNEPQKIRFFPRTREILSTSDITIYHLRGSYE